jgi:hypothetical protein
MERTTGCHRRACVASRYSFSATAGATPPPKEFVTHTLNYRPKIYIVNT